MKPRQRSRATSRTRDQMISSGLRYLDGIISQLGGDRGGKEEEEEKDEGADEPLADWDTEAAENGEGGGDGGEDAVEKD